jgi:peptide deformylase
MDIVLYPNSVLTTPTERVEVKPTEEFIGQMRELMIRKRGIGLAANQIGLNQSFFIAHFSTGFEVCINPRIVNRGNQRAITAEGCLSILDDKGETIFKPRPRFVVIDVEYETLYGRVVKTMKRMDAKIFQHEMDHLNGLLCTMPNSEVECK